MPRLVPALIVLAALALAGCNNPDRFGTGTDAGTGGFGGAGVSQGALGDPNDPRSLAYFQQTVGDRVFFAVDQSTLSPEARSTLEGQAVWLTTNPGYAVVIEGHADEQGTREYNIGLSERRANAARDYLVSRGVAPNRMRVIPFGKERPVAVCSDESCYTQNRRAVTVLSQGAGA
jgi:peptidoglycan-associated lipoprotein